MGKVLAITAAEYAELPEAVKEALITEKACLIVDLSEVQVSCPTFLSYAGEKFNIEQPCVNPACQYDCHPRQHFHSENDKYVYAGDFQIGRVFIAAVSTPDEA